MLKESFKNAENVPGYAALAAARAAADATPHGREALRTVPFTAAVRRRLAAASLAAITAAGGLALTACSNPVQDLLEGATAGQLPSAASEIVEQATDGAVSGVGSSEVPDDFPAIVPLPSGKPVSAVRYADEGKLHWMLQYRDLDGEREVTRIADELLRNGFAEDSSSGFGGAVHVALYSSDEYTVSLGLLGEAGDQILQLMVFTTDGS